MSIYWPIFLVVGSNVFYHICAKLTPKGVHPLMAVIVTYLTGTVIASLLYMYMTKGTDIMKDISGINWTSFLFGAAIVGLEVGNIYMYKLGWNMNTGYLLHSAIFAIALLVIGRLLFNEQITFLKAFGTLICLTGIYFINK